MIKNTIIIIIIAVIIAIGAWLAFGSKLEVTSKLESENPPIDFSVSSVIVATSTESIISSTTTSATTTKKINRRDPWQVLSLYTEYLKARDIEGVKSLSYQQSVACADPKKQKECFVLMADAYDLAKNITAEDYLVKMEDKKQLVFLTATVADNSLGRGYRQGIIIFTKTETDELKVLYFNPNRSWFVNTTSNDTSEATEEKLRLMMVDEDRDAVEDRVEACVGEPAGCVKTDPTKRDTDGDSWWDGVERFFTK